MVDEATLKKLAKFKASALRESLEDRAETGDGEAALALERIATDWADDDPWASEGEVDPLFRSLDDWSRAELLKAIREDDGRRCIDVLKRAAA